MYRQEVNHNIENAPKYKDRLAITANRFNPFDFRGGLLTPENPTMSATKITSLSALGEHFKSCCKPLLFGD
jgi:hypothetical protein